MGREYKIDEERIEVQNTIKSLKNSLSHLRTMIFNMAASHQSSRIIATTPKVAVATPNLCYCQTSEEEDCREQKKNFGESSR